MNTKNTLVTLSALAILIVAALPTHKAEAAPTTHETVTVTAPKVEVSTSPVNLGSAHSNGSKAAMFVPAAEVRKVKHTDNKAVTVTTWEDGSWEDSNGNSGCNAGEICNANGPSTIFEDGSWIDENGNTGCMSWGICQ